MRIHYLSDSELPSRRANSVHVMKMCGAFAADGHEVTLFAYRFAPEQDVHAYYDVHAPFAIRSLPSVRMPAAKRVARIADAWRHSRRPPRPDVFYGRDLYAMLAARGTGVPLVFEAHTPPQNRTHAWLLSKLLAAKSLARLVVISSALRRRYEALFPEFPRERLLVAHDAADAPLPRAAAEPIAWPGRPGVQQVGYVGSLLPGKGADLVVALARRLPQLDFHVLGGAPAEVQRLRILHRGANLHLHGYVEHHRVPAYLAHMDIALLPADRRVVVSSGADISDWMSPLKLFEYMAARLPIVASALPVIGEVLTHEVNALLVPPGNEPAWAAAVERLATDSTLRQRLARRAHADFDESYTWRQRGARVLAGLELGGRGD